VNAIWFQCLLSCLAVEEEETCRVSCMCRISMSSIPESYSMKIEVFCVFVVNSGSLKPLLELPLRFVKEHPARTQGSTSCKISVLWRRIRGTPFLSFMNLSWILSC
jgi:hypothetical protein